MKSDGTKPNYTWWHGLELDLRGVLPQGHLKVIPRSSQGHSKVKSTKKSKIYMFFTNSVNLEVYVTVEPRLDPNMELYWT